MNMRQKTESCGKLISTNHTERRGSRLREFVWADAGQGLAEIALMIPMLLILVLGIIELGRLAYFSIEVANAASAGARYGAQSLVTAFDLAGMRTAAISDAQDLTALTVPTATYYCSCASGAGSSCAPTDCPAPDHRLVYVQVNTRGTLNTLFNYPGIGASFTVNRQAVLRVAQ